MSMNYEDILNMPMPGMVEPEREVIGGFYGGPTAETGSIWPEWAQDVGAGRPTTLEGGHPAYRAGDEFVELRGLTTEDRVRLQQQLVAVGLVSNAVYGEIDDNTVRGFGHVLAMANRSGERWQTTLGRISTNPELQGGGRGRPEFEPEPYLAPDYATLAQNVKGQFRKVLGRDPDQAEMAELVGELQGWDRQSHQAQTGAQRMAFDQAQQPGEQGGGTVQQVDPMARFAERFDEKYQHEMDFLEDKEQAQVSRQVVEAGAGTLSQMSKRGV